MRPYVPGKNWLVRTGVCPVCKQPTRLHVHVGCGVDLSTDEATKRRDRKTRKQYLAGVVPPFAKL